MVVTETATGDARLPEASRATGDGVAVRFASVHGGGTTVKVSVAISVPPVIVSV